MEKDGRSASVMRWCLDWSVPVGYGFGEMDRQTLLALDKPVLVDPSAPPGAAAPGSDRRDRGGRPARQRAVMHRKLTGGYRSAAGAQRGSATEEVR
jgi:hypothetical protein